MYNNKILVMCAIVLVVVGLFVFSSVSFEQKEPTIKETVCYSSLYSIENGQVVEVEPSKCVEVER